MKAGYVQMGRSRSHGITLLILGLLPCWAQIKCVEGVITSSYLPFLVFGIFSVPVQEKPSESRIEGGVGWGSGGGNGIVSNDLYDGWPGILEARKILRCGVLLVRINWGRCWKQFQNWRIHQTEIRNTRGRVDGSTAYLMGTSCTSVI